MSIKIQKFNLQNNSYIRFKKYGKGQPILLLHTFRNRLEYCENVANLLKNNYSVYIIDLPGFGDSSINVDTQYTQEFFTDSIIYFIEKKKLKDLIIAGESIGGVLPISISLKIPRKIEKIFSFNPYDYDEFFGDGISRGNFFARFIMFHCGLPLVGKFFIGLENKFILRNIMNGGFTNSKNLTDEFLNLLIKANKKPGYIYHFRNVLSNFKSWSNTKNFYNKLKVPIKLVYGEDDWANKANRYSTMNKLNLNTYLTINDCGHFSFLEKPKEVANIILR
ncbi:MAG: 2-succinyl-6-hydroxy-2,4-cyclohexadiene-1-carboxylate synthase [Alphaproteobacteria bacterium MarineAlpha8_Bin1]|nr:MAG: 2-succinyl-6-hydroxy-2,4-cyclohexadiene-1-carboxylate synthase [Alphaproteobacteria bacterium MarineAlpha8_Bin1]